MSGDSEDKITVCVDISKKIALVLKDPTGGREMAAEERNKRRQEAFDDINTCIDTLATFASACEGFTDIISLQSKYK